MHDNTPPAGDAPACPGPPARQTGPKRYHVPAGAVDTHAHVIGVPPDYPFVSPRSYTPPVATAESYLAMLDATGMAQGVLIQVSVHGTDNRLMIETLKANRQRLRGIAVVDPHISERECLELKEAGVVGLRLNILYKGGVGLEHLERYGALCKELGWHLQFLIDARHLPEFGGRIAKLPVPAVFDHTGHFPTRAGIDNPGFRMLVNLVKDGAWVKLSGAYRNTVDGPPYADTIPFARLLVQIALERCLWGSDWPHVANWAHMMTVGDLLDLFGEWVPTEAARKRVFVDNPKRLYGF